MNPTVRSLHVTDSTLQAGLAGLLPRSLRAAFGSLVGGREHRVETFRDDCLQLVGSLDKRVAPEIKRQAKAFASAEGNAWTVDLSAVRSWDSEGLAALVYALDVSELNGKQFTLLDPCPALRHTLQIAQLHHLFTIATREA